jgi:hypothetical protein
MIRIAITEIAVAALRPAGARKRPAHEGSCGRGQDASCRATAPAEHPEGREAVIGRMVQRGPLRKAKLHDFAAFKRLVIVSLGRSSIWRRAKNLDRIRY